MPGPGGGPHRVRSRRWFCSAGHRQSTRPARAARSSLAADGRTGLAATAPPRSICAQAPSAAATSCASWRV